MRRLRQERGYRCRRWDVVCLVLTPSTSSDSCTNLIATVSDHHLYTSRTPNFPRATTGSCNTRDLRLCTSGNVSRLFAPTKVEKLWREGQQSRNDGYDTASERGCNSSKAREERRNEAHHPVARVRCPSKRSRRQQSGNRSFGGRM